MSDIGETVKVALKALTLGGAFIGMVSIGGIARDRQLEEGNFRPYTEPGTCQVYVGDLDSDGTADVARTYCVGKAPITWNTEPTPAQVEWYENQ